MKANRDESLEEIWEIRRKIAHKLGQPTVRRSQWDLAGLPGRRWDGQFSYGEIIDGRVFEPDMEPEDNQVTTLRRWR